MRKLLLSFALLVAFAGQAFAQAIPVSIGPSRFDAGSLVAVGTNFNTINAQSVATTVNPGAGLSIYVTALYMASCESNTTGTAVTNANFTTTNLYGAQWPISSPATLGLCAGPGLMTFVTPLKAAAPGTVVTLTSPTAGAQVGYATRIYYYVAQ